MALPQDPRSADSNAFAQDAVKVLCTVAVRNPMLSDMKKNPVKSSVMMNPEFDQEGAPRRTTMHPAQ